MSGATSCCGNKVSTTSSTAAASSACGQKNKTLLNSMLFQIIIVTLPQLINLI